MDNLASSKPVGRAFVHKIRVSWADCDPARIVYTGRIPCFALEAIEAWWKQHIGIDWYEMNVDRDMGMPFVHLSVDFRYPVTPRYELDCHVSLIAVGKSSVRFSVSGLQDSILCFEGEFVEARVIASTHQKSQFPPDFRAALLEHYQASPDT